MRRAHVTTVAVYERLVRASLERIWENVLDWEHLPALHRDSFAGGASDRLGRVGVGSAQVRVPGRSARSPCGSRSIASNLRYVTATTEGPGAGTEIWTSLEPKGEHETQIRVEFLVPDVSPERVATLGERLPVAVREALGRGRGDDAPAPGAARPRSARPLPRSREVLELGALADVRAKLPLDSTLDGRPFRIVSWTASWSPIRPSAPIGCGPLEAGKVEGRHGRPVLGTTTASTCAAGRSADGRALRLAPPPRIERAGELISLLLA